MLVLSRKIGETTVAVLPSGERFRVKIVEIRRGQVRLGFIAPDDVTILREELMARPQPELAQTQWGTVPMHDLGGKG